MSNVPLSSSRVFEVSPQALSDLGWHHILDALAENTATDPGAAAAGQLRLSAQPEVVRTQLAQVRELMTLQAINARLPLGGLVDIRGHLQRAVRGGVLDVDPLRDVAATASAVARTVDFLRHHADTAQTLATMGSGLASVKMLADELSGTFDASGRIRDDASPELAEVRRKLVGLHRNAKSRLDGFLARPDIIEICQDDYYTVRDERYVVPVIASFQSSVPGIIHGTSNTAQTVFIEPQEFIELNNQIKIASAEVRVEERRVLKARSEWVAAEADDLGRSFTVMIALDLLGARARLATGMNASVPKISSDGSIALKRAFNPLLMLKGTRNVVPNDITLTSAQRFVVITGPNTGGKTVTLNTVGLLALMLAAGMPIPAEPDSHLPLFDGLFTLIGDPQDLQRDLSTFSGHLTEISAVLAAARPNTLVVLDEIIVGTEPTQGAGLAIAVLERLADLGVTGLVTTHYERLKTMALEDARFSNASVGFDPKTLAPDFVLTSGLPGASNPFETALRLGLDPAIIKRARAVAGGHEGIGQALGRLSAARQAAETAQLQAEQAQRRADARAAELEDAQQRLARRARDEIRTLYADIRAEAEAALEGLRARTRELQKVGDLREIARLRRDVIDAAAAHTEDAGPIAVDGAAGGLVGRDDEDAALSHRPRKQANRPAGPHDAGPLPSEQLRPGVPVFVISFNKPGVIVSVKGKKASVTVGGLKLNVAADQLRKLGGAPAAQTQKSAPSKRSRSKAVSFKPAPGMAQRVDDSDETMPPPRSNTNSVDVRGRRRDEVEELVAPLLDRAYRERALAIWVIHGHGTGVLKDETRQFIRRSPYISRWRPGNRHEGGDGVTIAWLAED